jgi:NADPH:quinone reductase-like Zn-dependent oxidoreductase
MTEMMQAFIGGVGAEWELREIAVPAPDPGEMLVRVRAAALNRADLLMLDGSYNPSTTTPGAYTAGFELAGEVVAAGEGVRDFSIGDRVMGNANGAFAPYAVMDERLAITVPGSLDLLEAAALPVALYTEHDALVTQGGFTAGDTVLVVGAASSIGLVAVQMAKALGAALVIATTTSDRKVSHILSVGADLVVNTSAEDLSEKVLEATGGAGVDIALDHVGGDLFAELLAATRIGGLILNIGRLGGSRSTIDLDQLSYRRLRVIGTTFSVRTTDARAEVYAALAPEVVPAVADGRIRAVVDRVLPFADARRAAKLLRANEPIGKLLLEMP